MKKLGFKGKKTFKIIHICLIIIWVGGIVSWLPLMSALQSNNYNEIHVTYLNLRSLAYGIIGWAGIGTLLTGLVLGIFTDWKLFKYNWVTTKFFTFFVLTLFEYFFVELKLFNNISIIESKAEAALTDPTFLNNYSTIKYSLYLQLIVFLLIIIISYFKPLSKKERLQKG
jgi:putative copper export protein